MQHRNTPADAPRRHRRGTFVKARIALSAALAAAAAGGVVAYANAAGTTATTTAAIPASATGDSRTVTEPAVPKTVCRSLAATLTLTGRKASSAQEAAAPDTSRIQQALDACKQSGSGQVAVKLTAGGSNTAFLTGPLTVPQGVVLLLDSPVTLYGSLRASDYQISGKSTCGTVASSSGGCKPLISVSGAHTGIEAVRASNGTQGRVDGRGDLALYGTSTSWWDLAEQAKNNGGSQNNPRMIQAVSSNDFTLYDLDLVNAPNFHVSYQNGTGFTAWGVRIKTPAGAHNTDGIDPSGATDVTVSDSYVMAGDDGIAIKGGSNASKNITIRNSHFYGTHGISIGSETAAGVSNVLVTGNTLDGSDANGTASVASTGLRIKSSGLNGGAVTQVTYTGTCITRTKQPLVFDTHYATGSGSTPSFTGIVVNGVKATASTSGAKSVISGYDAGHPVGLTLLNVALDTSTTTAQYATVGLYNSTVKPSGTGVTTTSVTGTGSVPTCTFPGYPAL
ncbi:glycoside hydrolase family 28 protein [Streptomyces sp. NPDC094437]|uniref:glycoside hydrolase family 28 protein n=1 Tax=Streptomyces sp. NPDC094437 TaxID=3366060 RepID=UPI003804E57F